MEKLCSHVETVNWDAANSCIDKNKDDPDVVFSACSLGRTILHIAVISGREEIVEKLIEAEKEKEKLLKSQDNPGYTALALAVKSTDKLRMAKFMVGKCKDLLIMNTKDDEIPVLLASANGHKHMTRYLCSQTPWDEMSEGQVVHYGGLLLTRYISAQIFELEVDSNSYSDSLSRNIINKTSHVDQHKGRVVQIAFPLYNEFENAGAALSMAACILHHVKPSNRFWFIVGRITKGRTVQQREQVVLASVQQV
ncbi:hypothetical protein L6164_028839 [Bauhinia variegata]|uniref:Uncharacterized protein n=1 Tax=Bauhinia variegata TaxID=167791 RepID=A0ACB9L7U7_BAUVA|nr:hypothetical protein L6164_028839 [Bauhinia variegata]